MIHKSRTQLKLLILMKRAIDTQSLHNNSSSFLNYHSFTT